jgi:lipopolysaccharide transport system permease protein
MKVSSAGPPNGVQVKQPPATVYGPESELHSPARLVRSMGRDLLASRELAWRLLVRDLSARYRQSILGVTWAFLTPLATAAVFVLLNRQGTLSVDATRIPIPYPAFVILGTVLWQLFADSLYLPLRAVTGGKSMLAKVNFPREALLLSGIGQVLFDFGIKLLIVAAVFVCYGIELQWGILLAPFAILVLMLLGLMLGLLLMPLGVLYNDVSSALGTVLGLWFFLTPVVYPPRQHWPYSLLDTVNPVAPVLVGARDLLATGTLSDPLAFAVVSVVTLLGLGAMWVLYRVSLPILVERMSA